VALGVVAGTIGGPRSYGIGLARALVEAFPGDRWMVLTDRPEAFDGVPVHECVRVPFPARVLRHAVEATLLPRLVRRLAPDVYHGTKHGLPPRLRCPSVATIHDLAFFALPGTFPRLSGMVLRAEARAAVRRARRIVAPSESTRADLVRFLAADPARIAVVPNGVADAFRRPVPPEEAARVRARWGLPDRFVACVGTLQPRKNPDVLLDAFAALSRSGAAAGVGLLFVGRRGWMAGPFLRRLAAEGPAVDARLLEGVPDGDLPALLAAAEVFVSPTSYEGFGLSIAEAMAAGRPVIAGDGSSVPEVVGTAGVLVPGRDRAALESALGRLLRDPEQRRALGEAARRRAAAFTWEVAARRVRAVYDDAVRG